MTLNQHSAYISLQAVATHAMSHKISVVSGSKFTKFVVGALDLAISSDL